jgi:hypothetical protein
MSLLIDTAYRNALYTLLYYARRRPKRRIKTEKISPEDVLGASIDRDPYKGARA